VVSCLQVLQDLIEEDERVIETWYLFAMCLHAGGEHGEAASAVERGQALANTLGMPADDPLVLAFVDTKVGSNMNASRYPLQMPSLVQASGGHLSLQLLLALVNRPFAVWLPVLTCLPSACRATSRKHSKLLVIDGSS
jgi:hypothetical protein